MMTDEQIRNERARRERDKLRVGIALRPPAQQHSIARLDAERARYWAKYRWRVELAERDIFGEGEI